MGLQPRLLGRGGKVRKMESKLTSNDYTVLRELVGKEIERCVNYEQSSERGPSRDFWRDLSCFYIKMLDRFPRED